MMIYVALFVIGLCCFLGKRIFRDVFHPAVLFLYINFLAVCLPVVIAPDFFVSIQALYVINLFCLSLLLGAVLSQYILQGSASRGPGGNLSEMAFDHRRVRLLIWVCSFFSIASGLYVLLSKGLSWTSLLSVEAIVDVASSVAIDRYADEIPAPAIARVFVTFGYLGALFSGFTSGLLKNAKILRYLPLIGVFGFSIVTTARAPLIYAGILWAAGRFSSDVFFKQGFVRFKLRSILAIASLAIAIFVFFIALQAIRGGSLSLELALSQVSRMRVWFFGYLGGFSVWLDGYTYSPQSLSMGEYTFAGAFDALGIAERRIGIYTDFVNISSDSSTNIFTAYRSLLMDYGLSLGLLLTMAMGAFANLAYVRARRGYVYWCIALQAVYCYSLWLFVTSFFAYNLLLAVFPLMMASLKLSIRKKN